MANGLWEAMRRQLYGDAGVYCLVLWLPRARSITVSRKGSCRFERGWYVYTGSAKRNLLPRLMRHLRRRKTLHWHVDLSSRRGQPSTNLDLALDCWGGMPDKCDGTSNAGGHLSGQGIWGVGLPVCGPPGLVPVRANAAGSWEAVHLSGAERADRRGPVGGKLAQSGFSGQPARGLVLKCEPWLAPIDRGLTTAATRRILNLPPHGNRRQRSQDEHPRESN